MISAGGSLSKRLLTRINKFLQPNAAVSYGLKGMLLNPSVAVKRALQYSNRQLQGVNSGQNKKSKRNWSVGLVAIAMGLFVGYWEQQNWISPAEYSQRQAQALYERVAKSSANLVDRHVLKNQPVSTELQKLLYSICLAANVVHLTTESINKLLAMDELRRDASRLTNLLLIQKVFRELAEDRLRQVVVMVLRDQNNRQFLQDQILNFLGGEFFQQFVSTQFHQLMLGIAFKQLISDSTTGTIKGNLKSAEFKQDVYGYIKDRLM